MAPGRNAIAVSTALGTYLAGVVPQVRRQLHLWREDAGRIPDPALRRAALSALTEKGLNVEAVAVFATLAPRATRGAAIGAIATLQIAIDYIDELDEQPAAEPLQDGLQLHRALAVALTPGAEPLDWYRFHPQGDDDGYLSRLVAACQESVRSLPSAADALPLAHSAARRCGEGQSHTHAAAGGDVQQLRRWAEGQDSPADYRWWEVAAGASSSVAAHALIAAAADPRTSAEEAALIDAAYFPSIGALTVLLDDLIDLEEDAAAGEHSYLAYYPDSRAAADRLALIAARAAAATAQLRRAERHAAILSGVAGFYLSAAGAETPYALPIRDRLLSSLGSRPLVATMRLRRRI